MCCADLGRLLAAQRPAASPGQTLASQQPISHGYSFPPGNPSASAAGYALPQPRSSGNLDLSQIKPTNSGSVSLADAIARARGIAAEKGVFDSPRGRK